MTAETVVDTELFERHRVATAAAIEAGRLALEWWSGTRKLDLSFKGRHDFLTAADGAVEKFLRERLAEAFPGDSFVGEESGGADADSVWVVDPIDGTANFATKVADWCISIAYVRRGVPLVGIIHAPVLAETYAAALGLGATRNGERIRASDLAAPNEVVLDVDAASNLPKSAYLALLERLIAAGFDFRRAGSCALALARVASGSRHGYMQAWTKPWDALAGLVLVREAGGRTNAFERGVFEACGNPIIAAGGALYPVLAKIAREAGIVTR